MGVYDQAGRYLIKQRPESFFRWRVPHLLSAWSFEGWADARTIAFPGEPDRTCDTVAVFVHRQTPERRLLLVAELQAEPDADMLERLGEYAFRLRRELRHDGGQAGKYPVLCLVVNLTGAEQSRELAMTADSWDGASLVLRVAQGTFRDEDAAATLARIAGGELDQWVLPWLPLLRGAAEDANLAEWQRLAALVVDNRDRGEIAALAKIFADLAGTADRWKAAVEDLGMQVSPTVEGWKREAVIERLRKVVLKALALRLGPPPPDLAAKIGESTNPDELERWFEASQLAGSLSAFRTMTNL